MCFVAVCTKHSTSHPSAATAGEQGAAGERHTTHDDKSMAIAQNHPSGIVSQYMLPSLPSLTSCAKSREFRASNGTKQNQAADDAFLHRDRKCKPRFAMKGPALPCCCISPTYLQVVRDVSQADEGNVANSITQQLGSDGSNHDPCASMGQNIPHTTTWEALLSLQFFVHWLSNPSRCVFIIVEKAQISLLQRSLVAEPQQRIHPPVNKLAAPISPILISDTFMGFPIPMCWVIRAISSCRRLACRSSRV